MRRDKGSSSAIKIRLRFRVSSVISKSLAPPNCQPSMSYFFDQCVQLRPKPSELSFNCCDQHCTGRKILSLSLFLKRQRRLRHRHRPNVGSRPLNRVSQPLQDLHVSRIEGGVDLCDIAFALLRKHLCEFFEQLAIAFHALKRHREIK